MNHEEFLPIGTVVILKNAKKRLMITSFCVVSNENKEIMYDYSGCAFPEGIIKSEKTFVFNHDQIEKVVHFGLIDDEEKEFKKNLKNLLKVYKEQNKK